MLRRHFIPIILLILCTSMHLAQGQGIQITLGSFAHPDITKSLICISDFQGNVFFEEFLTTDEIEFGTIVNAIDVDIRPYCISVINEYQIDSINDGNPFILARTFYNLSSDIEIVRFEHPVIGSFYREKTVLLDLQGVHDIDFWQHASRGTISEWKQRHSAVWAQPNVWPDEDLFVVMKSANENRYRYLYMPQDELPDLSGLVRSTDAIRMDWKFLPNDLKHYSIKLPLQSGFSGIIYAMNGETGNRCVFLHEYNSQPREVFDLFLPSQSLESLHAKLEWHGRYRYNYSITGWGELNFPYYDKSRFKPGYYEIDSTRIQTMMSAFPEYFRIKYTSSNPDEMLQVGRRLSQTMRSQWFVIGANPSAIDFVLPNISSASKQEFITMEGWFVECFENVKILEEETEIDWINFFGEYNMLRVIYSDPYED